VRLPTLLLAAAVVAAPAGDGRAQSLEQGEALFQRCASCHTLDASPRTMPGPSLHGVIGRRAGTLAGFDYSEVMVAAGRERNLRWSETALFDYLANTEAYVPGTAMGYLRIASPDDRRALIAYIKARGG
jgi:cytochrome c